MAEAALAFLVGNLQKLLVDQVHLISGAKSQLKHLQNELESMKAFLEESAKMEEKGPVFRQFERQVRDAVHVAEDTLDECLTRAEAGMSRSFLMKCLSPNYVSLAKKVKSIRNDPIQHILERSKEFTTSPMAQISDANPTKLDDKNKKIPLGREDSITGFEGEANTRKMFITEESEEPEPFFRQDNVVGFEEEADTIIKYLNEESEPLEVISIIGMPGLGKTALARKIFNDKEIEDQFPVRIWLDISQKCERRKVFLNILKNFVQSDMSSYPDTMLAETIKLCLMHRKFLLFLDDLWKAEDWKDIKAALPKGNKLGKVLITSRHENVANEANRKREPYRLGFLDARKSWELLQLKVFGDLESCPPRLEQFGKIIARDCGGVPLAIVVIGGILKKYSTSTGSIETKNEWEKMSDNVQKYFNSDEKKRTKDLIALSFNELPLDLRDCFLYLGMFPEESEIPVWKLIRMWIAEGFIQQKPNRSLEEVAEDNLKDLVSRNLVMVDNINTEGHIKTCHIHDLIREFCKIEASIENQNLFQVMEISNEGIFDPPVSRICNHRRLCIHSHVRDFLCQQPKGPRVRSFVCFAKDDVTSLPENIPPIPADFNVLRVIEVSPIKLTKIPPKLSQLIHLRYIALSSYGDNLRALPRAISKLWNLETITIDTQSPTFEIEADIWKMRQLRHLKTKAAIVLNKKVKGTSGENLRSLSRLSVQCCTEGVFNRARYLKNLGIRGQLRALLKVNYLEKLDKLEKLKLVYDASPEVASENPLHRLPEPEGFPPNLRILELSSTFLVWRHMSTLGRLLALEVLKLKENAFVGKWWEAAGGGFPSLEILVIAHTDLVAWTAKDDPFPKLRHLVLKNCEELLEIPLELGKNLQTLDIERLSESAVESARKIARKKDKTQAQQIAEISEFKLIIDRRVER